MKSVVCIIGVIATLCHGHAAIRYVDLNNATPAPPYTDWSTAATGIQQAIDAAEPGDLVLVTNGVYETGGQLLHGALTNRIVIAKPITVASVNGPAHTTIRGYQVPVLTNGDEAIRCAYLINGATLSGFALTQGATRATGIAVETNGAGVWVETQCMLSNCIVSGNIAAGRGGGATIAGRAVNCIFSNNVAVFGGGVYSVGIPSLTNCIITDNIAVQGGGAFLDDARVMNCTIVANSADIGGGVSMGSGSLNNTIIYYNTAPSGSNFSSIGLCVNCCLNPLPVTTSLDCFTNEPGFVDLAGRNLRLSKDSPCINAGRRPSWSVIPPPARFTPLYGLFDLDENPRVVKGTVDIGAYEFQSPESALSYFWAFTNGLAHDGSMDDADADGDGASNLHEFRANTNPKNPSSYFRITSARRVGGLVILNWSPGSVAGTLYMLERSTNPAGPFEIINTNVIGNMTADSSPPVRPQSFYRMIIAEPD